LALVDLPGYGYAHASKSARSAVARVAERYLLERDRLRGLVVLLDARRSPEEDERFLVELATSRSVEIVRVATKIDKLGRAERMRRLRELDEAGLGPWLPFSAVSREGRGIVIAHIIEVTSDR
jgi:GTP-binding protein